MSRAPPFPARRRSPSNSNGASYSSQPSSAPGTSGTRPLQISRQGSRPTTPVSGYSSNNQSLVPPNTAPLGPSRPQRSERRARQEYSESERTSTASQDYGRDSFSASRSDTPGASYRNMPNSSTTAGNLSARSRLNLKSPVSDVEGTETTPTSLKSALSAFQSAGTRRRFDDYDEEYQKERQQELEAEKARQQRIRDRAPGARSKGSKAGEIDAILDQVKDGWEFVVDPNFNNVDLALQLLDTSALGKDRESFQRTKNMLSRALKGSVDKYYQAFAASLPHHASLLSHLGTTQTEITSARTALLEAKEALGSKRTDLIQLWNRGQMLEEMLKILDQIEHLKTVPDLLETLMSEKRLLQASVLLVRSLKIINKADMLEIGAVSDLRSYLVNQETALREILIDELQSHLYLKSFWCESRWASYVPNQQDFPKVDFETDMDVHQGQEDQESPPSPSLQQRRLTRFLNNLGLRPNDPPYDLNDNTFSTSTSFATTIPSTLTSNFNPEADSFAYMETLLEALAVLGKLGNALDTVAQRLPSEIFSLTETTLDEVEERADYGRRRSILSPTAGLERIEGVYVFSNGVVPTLSAAATTQQIPSYNLRLSALESLAKRGDHETLKDLFWTLYSKLDAVAQGLKVVTEVANRIGSRRDYKDASGAKPGTLFSLPEIWAHVQSEVRTLIRDYLTDEQQGAAAGRNPISSINEILREGKYSRDKGKPVFRFVDTDSKVTTKALRPHEDGLARVLKDTMPGLAPATTGDAAQSMVNNVSDDRLLGGDQHHRLLIKPDAFHVTMLFQPTLRFIHRIADIFPLGDETAQSSSAVLDEFVLKVYLPQLEEKVSDLFHEAVTGPDAFQPDPLSYYLSPKPLVKAATSLMALINSLCVIIQFYQRCSDRFQMLTTTGTGSDSHIAIGAQWAQKPELQPCFSELKSQNATEGKRQQLHKQETKLEMEMLGSRIVQKGELIPSTRNVAALAALYQSVSWFSTELNALKARPEDALSATTPSALEPMTNFTPATPFAPPLPPV
ncbi:hypothetical protein CVT24_011992, partial [Panaeolus cyanescens]